MLFQALALSRFFLGALRVEAILAERLHQSGVALARQREELQVNLHDSLGGALTDLQIHTGQEMQANSAHVPLLTGLHTRIAYTVKMFRSQLLFMEDLEMTTQDLLPGIQLTLLRRYTDAGREIDFEVSPEAAQAIEAHGERTLSVPLTLDLFLLVTELCTNDLKYGQGESFWRIGTGQRSLRLIQKNGIRDSDRQGEQSPLRATERAAKMGGRLSARADSGENSVEVHIPLRTA